MPRRNINLLFALFTLSGFTGLIYESVWSHYLRLFLGAAAFSQSFVLAAFMGGMALGAWLASRWSGRIRAPLALYAGIEALIGLFALAFHEVYVLLAQVSLDHVIPALGSPFAVEAYKYSVCALLIVPQTVLLGMTFPLLSGAVIRCEPSASGHHLSMLYFTNSIGAAIGALAAAFWLLGWLGMPGTMRLAGAANVALAAAVLLISRQGEPAAVPSVPRDGAAPVRAGLIRLFLAAAFLTGAASFVYEVTWIRLLALVLGSSFHAFELMLSAFITGLALGGLWMRRRIDAIAQPVKFAGIVQVAMGMAALATIFVYHVSFDWMAWAMGTFQRNDGGYVLFNLFSHAIAFAVMLPASFLAGMTLPLFTHILLRGGYGERAIGQVYAWNTLGAIAAVLFSIHVLIPAIGVKLALIVGASADIVLGGWLLRYSEVALKRAYAYGALVAGLLAATATARAHVLAPERLSSGVFRYGVAEPTRTRVFFYRDGKTASVAMRAHGNGMVTITTNGKPDAALELDPAVRPTEDEYTMAMLGILPLLIKPDARTFANIGWGSGLSVEFILSHSGPREVDTIEIEPAMVAAARGFSPRVQRAYHDPRSRVFFEDAKSYFARHGKRYDVITSEPSNPWVNGVASLFTTEFYRDAKRYLAPGGLFVQWLHLYELNDRLFGSMIGALGENFADYEVYQINPGDVLVVAVPEGKVPRPGALPTDQPAFTEQLTRLGIRDLEHITARRLGSKRTLAPLLEPLAAPVNSDFHPVMQIEAPRSRFEAQAATAVLSLAQASLPIAEMLAGEPRAYITEAPAESDPSSLLQVQWNAQTLARGLLDARSDPLALQNEALRMAVLVLKRPGALCAREPARAVLEQLQRTAELTLNQAPPDLERRLWSEGRWLGCAPEQLAPRLRRRLAFYAAVAARDPRAMLERARSLLADPSETGDDWRRFLLLAAMVGAQASDAEAEADRLWNQYRLVLYPNGVIPVDVVYVVNRHGKAY
jgi:spermidine synthase